VNAHEDATVVIKTFLRPACCVASVKSWLEACPGIRIIVVDDGGEVSPDLSGLSTVRHIKTEFDIGVSEGRNVGLAAADTRYVFVADDDNGCFPTCDLDAAVSALVENDLGVLGVGAYWFSEHDGSLRIEGESRVAAFTPCDATLNHFVCDRDVAPRWDARMKASGEHADYFLQCRREGCRVAGTQLLDFYRTRHAASKTSAPYRKFRRRCFHRLLREKWGYSRVSGWQQRKGAVP
jgi:glycosyltransferase involved in cell wall biosynthesis